MGRRMRGQAATVLMVVLMVILAACGDSTKNSPDGVATVTVTAGASSQTTSCTDAIPEVTGPFTTSQSGTYFHPEKSTQNGGDSCFGFRVYDGSLGDASGPAGTGSSTGQILVVFVNGSPVVDPRPYVMKTIRVTQWSGDQLDVQLDLRERGIDPESWADVPYRKSGTSVQASIPDQGSRTYITSFGSTGAVPTTSTSSGSTVPLERFRSGNQSAFRSPTGAIVCVSHGTSFRCETPNAPHRVSKDLVCGIYPAQYETANSNVFMWRPTGACTTTLQGQWATPHGVLQYSEKVTVPVSGGTLTCSSSTAGFRCVTPDGKGFTVSREGFARI
ncbi:hypothetical protein [Gordonia malaquae]|uniref:hypothetical protein n=1 Tax=Gordonia malaquae TaxID=410332 RepID=UPI0030FF3A79